MNEITQHQPQNTALATTSEPASMGIMAMILDAARDPQVEAAKVETMANLAMKLQDREQQAEFNRALNAAIMEMPVVSKTGQIIIPDKNGGASRVQGSFAKYEDIDRVVRPILQRHNLAIRFEIGEKDQTITVRPIISHANGFTERGEAMRLPLDSSGSKNNTQGAGSAATYGKRYTLCAALNIITEGVDDDGSGTVVMPYEREQLVLEGAEAAHNDGTYAEFYSHQSPKDRAWLVTSGNHARFGGETVLPAPVAAKRSEPKNTGGAGAAPKKHDTSTPAGWTAEFVDRCAAAPDMAALDKLKASAAGALSRLAEADMALWDKADAAYESARDRLGGGEGGNA